MKRQLVHRLAAVCILLCIAALGYYFCLRQSARQEYGELAKTAGPESIQAAEASGTPAESERTWKERIKELQQENPDTVAWIEIPDTPVSYPLLYSGDNDTYMTRTFSGEENASGAIFLEQHNDPELTDMTLFIYGHNMRDNSMFGSLWEYRDAAYLEEHPLIWLHTEEGSLAYEIFSVHRADTGTGTYTLYREADAGYAAYLESEKAASAYDTGVEPEGTEQAVILVTCTSDTEEGRFVVLGRRISPEES